VERVPEKVFFREIETVLVRERERERERERDTDMTSSTASASSWPAAAAPPDKTFAIDLVKSRAPALRERDRDVQRLFGSF
jgi:hypothetical protein